VKRVSLALRGAFKGWRSLALVPGAYAAILAAVGDLRVEHVALALLVLGLACAGTRGRQFLRDVAPVVAVGIGYDTVRYARELILAPERVVGCGLRSAELALFSVGDGRTLQDYFTRNHHPVADLVLAVPYTIFLYVVLAYGTYLYFRDRTRMRRFVWAFAIANYIAFAMYLALPAAPPWYIRAHGCEIDLATAPSAAALLRVDEYLGVGYFAGFYSRAASVFGALPSMHVAYPLIGLLTAWPATTWRTRTIHLIYAAAMAAAAVYLDHHWVIDVLAGWAVALVAVAAAVRVARRLEGLAPITGDRAAAPDVGQKPQSAGRSRVAGLAAPD
jgi:membrane-associated phospholipid phosphatase